MESATKRTRRRKPPEQLRTTRNMRATDDEWALIRKVAKYIKHDPEFRAKIEAMFD